QNREWRWGWDEKKPEEPVLEKPFGKGRILVALRSLQSATMHDGPAVCRLVESVEAKTARAAHCLENRFELTVHESRDGRKYLCVINPNTDAGKPATDTVILAGEFQSGVDLDVEGGFPVAFESKDGSTKFRLRLESGDFTLIELRK